MNIWKYISLFSLAFLILGQASESVGTEIIMIDNKAYKVPIGVSTSNAAVSDKVIEFYHKIGVNTCKKGDITWEKQSVADAINEVMRTGTKDAGKAIYAKAAKEGNIGCASPFDKAK